MNKVQILKAILPLLLCVIILFTPTPNNTLSFNGVLEFTKIGWSATNKILAVLSNSDFRDEEFFVPKEIFEKSGYTLITASSSLKPCKGLLGAIVLPDIKIDEANVDDYDAVVFIGGPGSSEYWNNPCAHKLAQDVVKKNKVVAAICIAPVTLANAGVLSNKKATVWHSEADTIRRRGAYYTGSSVESDRNVVTANGPAAARDFANAILTALQR